MVLEELHHIPKCQKKMRNTEQSEWPIFLALHTMIRYNLLWELHFKDVIHCQVSDHLLCSRDSKNFHSRPELHCSWKFKLPTHHFSPGFSWFSCKIKRPNYIISKALLSSHTLGCSNFYWDKRPSPQVQRTVSRIQSLWPYNCCHVWLSYFY